MEVTSKYLHLLKPLRALADNWDIDLATELSEYVGEVDKMTQTQHLSLSLSTSSSQEGEIEAVNFAQAALLIQNSASIYSRKVQYLYQLTHEAHNFIFHTRGNGRSGDGEDDGDSDSEDASGELKQRKKRAVLSEAWRDTFEPLDHLMPQKEFKLQEDDDALLALRAKSRSKWVNLAYYQVGAGSKSGSDELLDMQGESIGSRADFEMNDAEIHDNAGILISRALGSSFLKDKLDAIEANDDMAHEASFGAEQPPFHDQSMVDTGAGFDDGDDDLAGPIDFGFNNQSVAAEEQGMNTPVKDAPQKQTVAAEQHPPKKQKRMFDFWAMQDPHEPSGINKPFKKASVTRTFKMVERAALSRMRTDHDERPIHATTIRDFLKQARKWDQRTKASANTLEKSEFGEFDYVYAKQKARRDALLKPRQVVTVAEEGTSPLKEEHDAPMDHQVFDFDDMGQGFGGGFDGMDDGGDGSDNDQPSRIEPTQQSAAQESFESSQHQHIQSFEELCKLKIQVYMERANEFEQHVESKLVKSVKHWENKLHPLLEEQQRRGVFDVHAYEERVLETASKLVDAKKPIEFANVVQEAHIETFDVSRWFLSCLHLANAGKVVISKTNDGVMLIQKSA